MAEEGNIISNLNLDGPVPNGEDTSPAIGLISQYVKDLSVENPNAPESYQWTEVPEMAVDFNISARAIQPEIHEIELKINVTSKGPEGTAFIVELAYAPPHKLLMRSRSWLALACAPASLARIAFDDVSAGAGPNLSSHQPRTL